MVQHRPRRVALLTAVGGVAASCTAAATSILSRIWNPPRNPDPGNRRLHVLAAAPVFASLVPGAVRTSWQENPAKQRSGGPFAGGQGWDGPSVILTFTSSRSVRDVYRFYTERAAETGWTPWQKLSMGYTRSWTKPIAGKQSFIGLNPHFNIHDVNVTESGTPRSYSLTGST